MISAARPLYSFAISIIISWLVFGVVFAQALFMSVFVSGAISIFISIYNQLVYWYPKIHVWLWPSDLEFEAKEIERHEARRKQDVSASKVIEIIDDCLFEEGWYSQAATVLYYFERQEEVIAKLQAELDDCAKNINLKADFIDRVMAEGYMADEIRAEQRYLISEALKLRHVDEDGIVDPVVLADANDIKEGKL